MQTQLPRPRVLCAVCAGLLLAGCQHAPIRGGIDARREVHAITPEELFEVGLLQARRGDLLRAEQYLGAARSQGYDEPTVAYWLVRVCLAAGRYHSALDHAARSLRDEPANWRLRLVVASIHEALGDLNRARLELEHIVRAQPQSPLPRYRLALIYWSQGFRTRSAVPHLEAYLELDPAGPHAAEVETLLAHSRFLDPSTRAGVPAAPMSESEVPP